MENNIDTQLYSRQLGVIDYKTMMKLTKMKILILGMRGLGVEIAKNIILSGPKKVAIYDSNLIERNDLNSNYYLNDDMVQKIRRDKGVINKLKELNPYVICDVLDSPHFKSIDEEIQFILQEIKNFSFVVITEFLSKENLEIISEKCREQKIGYIYGCVMGVAGFIFEDFGEKHIITNPFGKEIIYYPINNIKKGKKTLITIEKTEEGFPVLNDDSLIRLTKINGMVELNSNIYKVNQINSFEYEIDVDSTSFNNYLNGGFLEEIIIPKEIENKSFKETLLNPIKGKERKFFDSSFIGRKDLVHCVILSLYDNKINLKEGNSLLSQILPNLNDQNFSKKIVEKSKEYFLTGKKNNENWINVVDEYDDEIELCDFDEKLVYHIGLWLRAQIPPIVSFIGGVIAQEILKYTGKFIPFNQWSWFEFEYLVRDLNDEKVNREPLNSRYDEQISIFGREIQNKLEKLNIFLVGVGAAGCEYLKNFAMMGVSSFDDENNKKGCLTLTDYDCIEISNLNRQFLFKKEHIGNTKSEVASKAIKKMNNNFNCKVFNARIGPENEHIFNYNFWEKQNIVFNAVDNKEARRYIDKKVTEFSLNSVDVGTLGTSATCSVFLNNSTLSYVELNPISQDEINTNDIGLCIMHAFPSTITHCIEWSRDQFEYYFSLNIKLLKKIFLGNEINFKLILMKEGLKKLQLKKINEISKLINIYINENYEDAVKYAYDVYYENFNENIQQILKKYPPDSKNKDGSLFYSGIKKIPIPEKKEEGNIDELRVIYIKSFCDLLFESFGIKHNNQYGIDDIKNILNNIEKKETEYKNNISNEELPKEMKKWFDEKKLLVNSGNKILEKDLKEIIFNKDSNLIQQNDFIYAGANLRAWNYQIPQCDKFKSSRIAGKIVPSITTSNACITGLASMQLYLLVQYNNFEDKLELFRNYFIDIGICSFDYSYPPKKFLHKNQNDIPNGWSIWDYIKIQGPLKVSDFILKIKENYGVNVEVILTENIYLYNHENDKDKSNELIEDLFEKVTKINIKNKISSLILKIIGKKDSKSVNMPYIKYTLKKNI